MAFEPPVYPTNAFTFLNHDSSSPSQSDKSSEHSLDQYTSPPPSETPPTGIADPAWVKPQRKTQCSLDVIVIGAGLGGLATAIALKLSGHKVRVLEQASVFGEVGAGIQVPPNSTRHFLSWGVGPHIEQYMLEPHTINVRRWKDGSVIGTTKLNPDFRQKYRAPYFVLHRADYHAALMARAKELGVEILGDAEVESYDFPTPVQNSDSAGKAFLTLKNGGTYNADLLIGTDGIKSLARTTILRSHNLPSISPKPTSEAAYRCTIPLSVLASNPSTAWVTETPNQNLWIGSGRHAMTYAIRGIHSPARLFNLVLCHPETRPPEQWPTDLPTLKGEVQRTYSGWDRSLTDIVTQVLQHPDAKVVKWPVSTIASLPTWIHQSEKMIVLGDAAHAMVPYMSQGAAIAVEDAAAIAAALSLITKREEVPKALRLVEKVRKVRAEGMQQASLLNGRIWHLDDSELQQARDEGMGEESKSHEKGWNSNQWSDPVCQRWTYGYDATKEIDEVWVQEDA